MCVRLVVQSCPTLCDPMGCSPPGSFVHGDSPGKNTGVGCHVLLQGIFPTQESNPGLLHCRQILYCLSHQGSPDPPRLQLKIQQAETKTWYNQINKNKNNFFKEVPNSYFLTRERHTDEKKVREQSGGGRRGHSRQKLLFLQMGGLMPRAWQAAAKACRDWQRALLRPPNSQRLSVHLTKKGLRITRLAHLAQPGV